MIRVLVMIAATGFLVSVVTLAAAVGIGGPDILEHAAWSWGPDGHWTHHGRTFGLQIGDGDHEPGNEAVRKLAWTGGDTLAVEVPAEIRYTQGTGPAELTINGPKAELDDLQLKDGRLTFASGGHHRHWGTLTVVMTAPNVSRFELDGSGSLSVEGYKQDTLKLDLSGDSEVKVTGEAKDLNLAISGSADTDLGGLKAQKAQVEIDGSGDAIIAPTDEATINISGSGDVTLLTRPAKVESNISGSGAIHQAEGTPEPPAPPVKASGPKTKT